MHDTSMETMKEFIVRNKLEKGKTVVDVGSYNLNGSYRSLFPEKGSKYIGADIIPGPNVDVIVGSPEWDDLRDIDAVISGQTIEHVADIPTFLSQIRDILKPGGLLCLIAPSEGPAHDHPVWVGHFSVERMTKVVEDAGFEVESCTINPNGIFCDCCCVAKKKEVVVKPQAKPQTKGK